MRFEFRAKGCLRFGLALFLLLWIIGWAAGEVLVVRGLIWFLHNGKAELAAGWLSHPTGWWIGGFALLWIAGWTLGGILAIFELARLVAGVDTLIIEPDRWLIRRGAGALSRTRDLPLARIRDIYLERRGALMIDAGKTHTVTTYGSLEEKRRVVETLRPRIPFDRESNPLPERWKAAATAGGVTRIALARMEGVGCLMGVGLMGAGLAFFTARFAAELSLWGLLASAAGASLLAALYFWALLGRREWHVRRGSVGIHRQFLGWSRTTLLDDRSLALVRTVDSDGDETTALVGTSQGRKVVLLREMNNDREVKAVAQFISAKSGWPIAGDRGDGAELH